MMTDSPSLHVDAERLVAFLIDGIQLTEAEHKHIIRCPVCVQLGVAGVSEELNKGDANA